MEPSPPRGGDGLINMRNTTKRINVDRTGYLAHLIYTIMENSEAAPVPTRHEQPGVTWLAYKLSGGAELWYDAQTHRLVACRPNVKLEPNEAKVFETHIQKAGYWPGPSASIFIDEGLNCWRGVVWTVCVQPGSVGVGESEPAQEGLF